MTNFPKKLNWYLVLATGLFTSLCQATQVQAQSFTQQVLVDGLNSPRGITIDSQGKLYIAEAGTGGASPCIASPSAQGEELCYGATGAIAILDTNTLDLTKPITNLPSLALPDGSDASGIHDLYFDAEGDLRGIIGLAGDPNLRDPVLNIPDFGTLIDINLTVSPSWSSVADLAAYEIDNNSDGGDVVSNPYSLVTHGNTTYVVDAGANALLTIDQNNQIDLAAVFPVTDVPTSIPGLPNPFPMQSVPTGSAIAPDGSIYVVEYTGFPFPPAEADIYRWDGQNLSVVASNFTNLIDLAFAPDGNLYALAYASNVLAGDFSGSLWRIGNNGSRSRIAVDGLQFSTGLAISDSGSIYIANNGYNAGLGEIIELEPREVIPEPSTIVTSVLLSVAFGVKKRFKKIPPLQKRAGVLINLR
ncbi:ScyD/ScyE family protein [Gloeocapsa sp. PCC 73106]|uniref:ScyD/ScyE family protein n=1 Tax=Gloeocapsa sp. PCC 73106 TaxID=102232 RepID=UPI0002ABD6DB|nr:ScyD/ScyE family protein [Gloeocapsa sp. PCC 73106]ELR97224.1 hypothetical protein GLO73106DRAFT_00010300 [Gloeocapsa sp. PCC 73106]